MRKWSRKLSPLWFVNYTEAAGTGRATEIKIFDRLHDAKHFADGKHGFIIRQDSEGNTLKRVFGNFPISAQQQLVIDGLLAL